MIYGYLRSSHYTYFYSYREIWKDQKHGQDLNKDELIKIMEKKPIIFHAKKKIKKFICYEKDISKYKLHALCLFQYLSTGYVTF